MINTTGLLAPQIPHTKALIDSLYINGFAFDHSSTGCGKMYCACAIARELNRPFVVIAPKSVIPQWEKVLKIFDVKVDVIVNYEKLSRGNTKWMRWKKLPDITKPWDEKAKREMPEFYFPRDAFIVLDEGHRCKGSDTSNSWMMIALAHQSYKILVSSATIATSPIEMKAMGFLAQLHRLYNFPDFCRVHGGQWTGRYGSMTFDMASDEARKSMLALNEYLFETRKCSSRLTVDDFGDLFPETHIVAEAYDLGSNEAKIQAVYDEMEAEIAKLDERCENYSQHIFAIMMEARRRAELCKVPLFVEMIEDLYNEGKSIVCFVNFTDTVDAINKRLEKIKKFDGTIAHIVGGQHDKDRQLDIDAFNVDKKRIMIANIAAGGIGISLHDLNGNFPRASIISPNYSAFQLIQALGRVWRQGGLTKSYQRVVFAAKTIEEAACRRVNFKISNLSTLNDGDLAMPINLFT